MPTVEQTIRTELTPDAMIGWDDLMSRCYAAAKLSMRGERYSTEDWKDAAAELVARILKDIAQEHTATTAPNTATAYGATWGDGVPARYAAFSRLYGTANNLRRSMEAGRRRDAAAQDGAPTETDDDALAAAMDEAATRGTPDGAHRFALGAMRDLGLRGEYAAYVAAYVAARTAEGDTAAQCADELGLPLNTLKSHLSRSRKIAELAPASYLARLLSIPLGGMKRDSPPLCDELSRTPDRDGAVPALPNVPASGRVPANVRETTVPATPSTRLPDWSLELQRARPHTAARLAQAARIAGRSIPPQS